MMFIIVFRVVLNCYTSGRPLLDLVHNFRSYELDDELDAFTHATSRASLHTAYFEVCVRNITLYNPSPGANQTHGTTLADHGLNSQLEACQKHYFAFPISYCAVVVLEGTTVISASLVLFGFSLYFILCLSSQDEDEEAGEPPSRARFLHQRPFLFVLLPKFAGGWSLISLLMFMNVSFAKKFFTRGDFELYMHLVLKSCFGRIFERMPRGMERRREARGLEYAGWRIVDMATIAVLLPAGAFAMRTKFMEVYFTSLVSVVHWHALSWMDFLGFINQVVGIFDFDFIEFNRVMLLKFAGSDSRWTVREMESVDEYFGLIFRRLVVGRLRDHSLAGLKVWAALVTFTSDSLQGLLLSDSRAEALRGAREDRKALLEVFLNTDLENAPAHARLEKLETYRAEWAATCGFKDMKERSYTDMSTEDHLKRAERIRILAQIENHMGCLQEYYDGELSEDKLVSEDSDDSSSLAEGAHCITKCCQ